MNVTVIYYTDDSKMPKLKGFSTAEKAKKWIDEVSAKNIYQHPQIMVPYAAIEAYQEMYELMRDKVFGKEEKERKEI